MEYVHEILPKIWQVGSPCGANGLGPRAAKTGVGSVTCAAPRFVVAQATSAHIRPALKRINRAEAEQVSECIERAARLFEQGGVGEVGWREPLAIVAAHPRGELRMAFGREPHAVGQRREPLRIDCRRSA